MTRSARRPDAVPSPTTPARPPREALQPFRDIRAAALLGGITIAVLVGTVGVWAATAPLSGAVIAAGKVVVESNVRRIQHPAGGVVAEIHVKDGDHVTAGDVLLRLDATTARANLGVLENQLHQSLARKARLEAERDGKDGLTVPADLADRAQEPGIAEILDGERNLLSLRRSAMEGQVSQLRERIAQTRQEIEGLTAQARSKRDQIGFITQELEGVRKLYETNLVAISRLAALEREGARLAGEEGQLAAETARARGRIAETELQIIQLTQDQRREVATELRELESKVADLAERRFAALDQLERIELKAPQSGIVHQNTAHTIGGVVAAGEQIMLIVPERDGLVVEGRVEPQMIARLSLGQKVSLRFSAFDAATTPDLSGVLSRIAADLSRDPQTGLSYYEVRIGLDAGELDKLKGKPLVPGMPVEAFIQTGERTAFAYLTKPIRDQLARAFRYD